MKVFISQPMNGRSQEEIKKERQYLIKKIHQLYSEFDIEIIDSVITDAPENATPLWYLGESIKLLANADLVVFAPNFWEARGCLIEWECCQKYGIKTRLCN